MYDNDPIIIGINIQEPRAGAGLLSLRGGRELHERGVGGGGRIDVELRLTAVVQPGLTPHSRE